MEPETTKIIHELMEMHKELSHRTYANTHLIGALIHTLSDSQQASLKRYLRVYREQFESQEAIPEYCRIADVIVASVTGENDDNPPNLFLIPD